MKYEKCPVCEEKLKNGICPMCGYDFKRLGQPRTLKDGHWDILTTDAKTKQPQYVHDEKRHPDFKRTKNKKKTTYHNSSQKKKKSKKGKWAIILIVIYLLQFLASIIPDILYNFEDFINQILTGLNL